MTIIGFMVAGLSKLLVFVLPFIFYPRTSEVFEFNKVVGLYIFTILIVAAWAMSCLTKKRLIFQRTRLDIPILLFLGSQGLSTIFSIDVHTSLFGYYSRFNGGLISLFCYALLYWALVSNVDKQEMAKIVRNALYAGIIVALWAIFEHYGYSFSCLLVKGSLTSACWKQNVSERAFATFGQPNWLAAYLVALLPITYSELQRAKQKNESVFWMGAMVVMFAAVLFTKSRSGLFALGVTFVIYGILQLTKVARSYKSLIYILFAFAFIFALTKTEKVKKVDTERMLITPSSKIRLIVWSGAIEVWKSYPILGSGVETFAFSYFEKRPALHNRTSEWNLIYNKAHNEYLNYLATTGALGLATYMIFIVVAFGEIWRSERWDFLAGFTSILITNFFGFSVAVINLFLFLLPGLALTEKGLTKKSAQSFDKRLTIRYLAVVALAGIMLSRVRSYWLADLAYAKGDWGRAVNLASGEPLYRVEIGTDEEIEKAIAMSPRNIRLLEIAANKYLDLGEDDDKYYLQALRIQRRLVELAPTYAKYYYALAVSYLQTGNTDEAVANLEAALALKPDYEKASKLLGIIR